LKEKERREKFTGLMKEMEKSLEQSQKQLEDE